MWIGSLGKTSQNLSSKLNFCNQSFRIQCVVDVDIHVKELSDITFCAFGYYKNLQLCDGFNQIK